MSSSSPSLLRSYLHLHFLVILWSFTAILGKLISIPAIEIVFYRTLFSFAALYIILKIRRAPFRIGRKNITAIFGTGWLIALHWILFFLAAQVSNISICLAGLATTSLWTSILEPLILRRKIKPYEPILGILAVVGISVVFDAVIDQYLGFIIAVGSGMLASIFTIINGQLVKKSDHYVISFYQMAGAFVFCALALPLYGYTMTDQGTHLNLTAKDVLWLLILALVCTVYSYSASIKLMHKLSAFTLNLTVNLEPVYGILMAVALFTDTEHMDSSFYWGTAIILGTVMLHPVFSYYDRRKMSKSIFR